MDIYIDTQGQGHPERRCNPKLRKIYDEARERIRHCFHSDDWAGSSIDFVAKRLLHEAYPDLSGDDIRTLVIAIASKIGSRGMVAGSHLA